MPGGPTEAQHPTVLRGLVLRRFGSGDEALYVDEQPGLVILLEGAARYEYGHEVPPVEARRLSLTWRWFKANSLEQLAGLG